MKVVLKLAIIVSILIFLFLVSSKIKEHMISSNIIILSKENTRDIYKRSDYINSLNKYDIMSRNLKTNDSLEWYSSRALDFTKEEREKLAHSVELIKHKAKKYPHTWRFLYTIPWKFAKVSDEVDYGFPHTHEDTIFLPEGFLCKTPKKEFLHTLVHEMIHIWQRMIPSKFEELYTLHWGFTKTNRVCGIVKYLKMSRTNPDIEHLYYIYRGKYLPLSIFDKDTLQVKYIGVPVLKNSKPDAGYKVNTKENTRDLISIQEYFNYFKLSYNHYHPNELSAEVIADVFMDFNNKYKPNSPAETELLKWLVSQN